MEGPTNDKSISLNGDDEFVVPHMDIACLENSLAYQKVLEEPWIYLHNWSSLAPSVQQELVQSFLNKLGQIKSEMAVTQGLFDPCVVANATASAREKSENTHDVEQLTITTPAEPPKSSDSS